jgi:ribosomal-protein-alanine N-acetyltransferase
MPAQIETTRLAARLPRVGDVDAMLALYGDPAVAARLYPDARPRAEDEVRTMIEADLAHWAAHGFGRYVWAERATGAVVARCGPRLALIAGRPEVDVHWTVRPDRHRRGYAAEAAEAAIRACFELLALESVTARARLDNAASQAVMGALDFRYEREVEHLGDPHRLYRRRRPGHTVADSTSASGTAPVQPAAFGLPVERPGSSSGPSSRDVSGAGVSPAPLSGPWRSPPPAPWPSGFSSGSWSPMPCSRGSSVGVASSPCWWLMRAVLPPGAPVQWAAGRWQRRVAWSRCRFVVRYGAP